MLKDSIVTGKDTAPSGRGQEGPTYRGSVEADWIDANGHMNVSFYDHVFDLAERELFMRFGIGDSYIVARRKSVFRLEKLVTYERELKLGTRIEVHSHVVWTDMKRVHHFHELWNVDENHRAAADDALSIHVDLDLRRSARMSDSEVLLPLAKLAEAYASGQPLTGVVQRREGRRL